MACRLFSGLLERWIKKNNKLIVQKIFAADYVIRMCYYAIHYSSCVIFSSALSIIVHSAPEMRKAT